MTATLFLPPYAITLRRW